MLATKSNSYTFQKDGIWYFSRRVPADLRRHYRTGANSRYRHFLRAGAENEDAQLSALQSSGYATDPMYSQKLKNIMKGLPDEEGQG